MLKKLINKSKGTSGITLIALVITVILMLILVGVTISAVVDADGLFAKTRNAANIYELEADNENKTITNLMNYIDQHLNGNFTTNNTGSTSPLDKLPIDEELKAVLKEANMTLTLENILNASAIANELGEVNTEGLENLTEEEKINKVLEGSSITTITLDHIITNKEFIEELIDKLSIQTVLNNQKLRNNCPTLIPTLTEADVTRSVVNGVIIYEDIYGGIIRTNGEKTSAGNDYGWKAFDGDTSTRAATSANHGGNPANFYVEYEFQQSIYAVKSTYRISNGSVYSGKRQMVIQGYDEENKVWEDLTKYLSYSGTLTTTPSDTQTLDYTKPYKKFRLWINSILNSTGDGSKPSAIHEFQIYGKAVN